MELLPEIGEHIVSQVRSGVHSAPCNQVPRPILLQLTYPNLDAKGLTDMLFDSCSDVRKPIKE